MADTASPTPSASSSSRRKKSTPSQQSGPSTSAGSSSQYRMLAPSTSAGSSSQHQTSAPSTSAAMTMDTMADTLPHSKVRRNYACTKCVFYTQNPRIFLHHLKNVHNEQLQVYECPHCVYASRFNQKVIRHVKMVHKYKNSQIHVGDGRNAENLPLPLVPPVRIRLPRFDEHGNQKLSELVIVEDVNRGNVEQQPEADEEVGVEDEEVDDKDEEFDVKDEEMAEEDQYFANEDVMESDQEEQEEEEEIEGEEEVDEEEEEVEEEEEDDDDDDYDGEEEDEQNDVKVYSFGNDPMDQDELSVSVASPLKLKKQKYRQRSTYIQCSVCSFSSHSQTLVNRHEKSAHLKKKFFRCMKCNYVTHMRARYTKHVKYHTMPMIKCEDCDFCTPYKWNLDRHNRNHSIDNPGTYRCSHCSFSADIKQSLTVHELNHHVPPIGIGSATTSPNRRRARVGASDAPGSAVNGAEIVTFETTKDDGIVEIVATETKRAAVASGSTADTSSSNVVMMTTTALTTTTSGASAMTFVTPISSALKIISVVSGEPVPSATKTEKPRRRPLPGLIPIGEQHRLTITPTLIRLPSPPVEERPVTMASRGGSPKIKIASFFDKLKAKVDETADLTCPVCQFESKCLSEFMRHQRMHNDNDDDDTNDDASTATTSPDDIVVDKSEITEFSLQLPPPPPVTAAELKSTRCQRCRKRCKTSTELVLHLATCRGTATVTAANLVNQPVTVSSYVPDNFKYYDQDNEQQQQPQHPMENKIFVWNTAVLPAPHGMQDDEKQHSVTLTEIITPSVEVQVKQEEEEEEEEEQEEEEDVDEEVEDEEDDDDDDEEEVDNDQTEEFYPSNVVKKQHRQVQLTEKQKLRLKQQQLKQQQRGSRKEGKIHKTVFKCPHCTFWAATASRFHVHIVGHLNRKPFECSCCAYRSNWRWDITKHIRLKSARRPGLEESPDSSNSHYGAKVLMTDETGRRNYSKYNGYLTVMEMDITDGTNKAAGGDLEDSKFTCNQKLSFVSKKRYIPLYQHDQHDNVPKVVNTVNTSLSSSSLASSPTVTVSDNRSKTVWKCKKCLFRDCDRLTVLNHVKGHYRRGEFDSSTGAPISSKQNLSENNIKTKNTAEPKELNDQKSLGTDRRKSKTPTTGTVDESMLILSTNLNHDVQNFLACPLCNLNVETSIQLKDHMERVHVSEETKYRCEYCQFWSEDKKAMLEHMTFAHEMDNGSVTTYVNDGSKECDESNSIQDIDMREDNDADMRSIDEKDSSNDMNTMEVTLENNDENILVFETVKCKSNINENAREQNLKTSGKILKKTYDTANENMKEIIVRAEESAEFTSTDVEIVKDHTKTASESITKVEVFTTTPKEVKVNWSAVKGINILYECNECWYFSNDKKKMQKHKELHIKRGALFNCVQCVFNVTNSSVLYHHYRYGHFVEEPELQYPEEIIIQTGHKDMIAKNAVEKSEAKSNSVDEEGPPIVWFYNKDSVPSFSKVFRCRYCPHTNRRRHNTIEHERMHSDHPEHQSHRLQQQLRASSTSSMQSTLHPCIRCTYVCSNAGVLASHMKVHSSFYGTCTVGFYDDTIEDEIQIRALEYVMELEQNWNKNSQSISTCNGNLKQSLDISDDTDIEDNEKFTELDEPILKFCPYCPARFFFRCDLRCHIRFHKVRVWDHSCDCCSFTARTKAHISAHEIVHCDEYAQRTAELLVAYPVSQRYPRPSEYPVSTNDCNSPLYTRVKTPRAFIQPKQESVDINVPVPTGRRQLLSRTTKRLRPYSDTNDDNLDPQPPLEKQKYVENNQRLQRSTKSQKTPTKSKNNDKPTNIISQYACGKCPAKFFKLNALYYHRSLHGSNGKHRCKHCDYSAGTAGNLSRHITVHNDLPLHGETSLASSLLVSETQKSRSKTKDKGTKNTGPTPTLLSPSTILATPSPQATKKIYSNGDKKNSSNSITCIKEEPFEIDPEFGPDMLGNPLFNYPTVIKNGVSHPKRYKCIKCPSAFDKREQFVVHLSLHGAQDKYQCDRCDYSVRYTANYIQHKRKHARDDEIRKNNEQAAAKLIEEQKLSNSSQNYHKPTLSNILMNEESESSVENELVYLIKNEPKSPIEDEPGSPIKDEPNFLTNEEPNFLIKAEPESLIKDEPQSPMREDPEFSIEEKPEYSIKEEPGCPENAKPDVVKPTEPMSPIVLQNVFQVPSAIMLPLPKKPLPMALKKLLPKPLKKILPKPLKKILPKPPKNYPNASMLKKWGPQNIVPKAVRLNPQTTKFRNEISDRQTAYELNAAYGSTGIVTDGNVGEPITTFRCTLCPYEGQDREQLDEHNLHHMDNPSSNGILSTMSRRPWKFSCRFCTYRTHRDYDLNNHIRVHFLRSTGTVLSSFAASSKGDGNLETLDPTDHVEFHAKRIVNNNSKVPENALAASPDNAKVKDIANKSAKPFCIFKDKGSNYGNGEPNHKGKTVRFSPDCPTPPILIDVNENQTSNSGHADKVQHPTVYVRLNSGKNVEIEPMIKKKKRGRK